jgi:choline dehydrogenase
MVAAVHQSRELVQQPSLRRYLRAELNPGPDVKTDAEIREWIRHATGTSYHPSGTCRMGVDAAAVVDSEARVQAVAGLRVVDASIMPKVITGNLNAPVMMMAEKIADRIKGVTPMEPSTAGYFKQLA